MLSPVVLSEETIQALDKEFIEFLSLYDINDEELLRIAFDQEPDDESTTSVPEEGE